MKNEPPSAPSAPPAKKRLRLVAPICALGILLLAFGAATALRSGWLREILRQKVVAALGDAAGGRAEIGRFDFDPFSLSVRMERLSIFGRERPGGAPLFSADSVEAKWNLISVWGLRSDFRSLRVDQPKFDLVFGEEGANDLPTPQASASRSQPANWAASIFDLKIKTLEVIRGELRVRAKLDSHWNEKRVPLDLRAEGVRFGVDYDSARSRYSGRIDLRKGWLESIGDGSKPPRLDYSGSSRFALYKDRLEIDSLTVATERSRISAVGSIANPADPRATFRYDASIDWSEAAEFLGVSGWAGSAASRGQADYDGKGWMVEAPLTIRARSMGVKALDRFKWEGTAKLRAAVPSQSGNARAWNVSLTAIDLAMLGGKIRGSASIAGGGDAPKSKFDLMAERASIPVVSEILRGLGVSLGELRWGGMIGGPIDVAFSGAGEHLVLKTDWSVEPATVIPDGYVPVAGIVRVTYRDDDKRLEFQPSSLQIGSSSISAEGSVDQRKADLHLRANAARSADLLPLVGLISKRALELPIEVAGPLGVSLNWAGSVQSPDITGKIDLASVAYHGLKWDRWTGEFEYTRGMGRGDSPGIEQSDGRLRIAAAQLTLGKSRIDLNGTVALPRGEFNATSPVSLHTSVRDLSVEELRSLTQAAIPIKGTLNGTFEIQGAASSPGVKGDVSVGVGELLGETFTNASAQIDFEPTGRVNARRIRIRKDLGTIEGEASVGIKDGRYRLDIRGSQVNLGRFARLRTPGVDIDGIAAFSLSGEGDMDRPALDGRIAIERLNVGGIKNTALNLEVYARDEKATFQWTATSLGGGIKGKGEAGLKPPYRFEASADFRNLDLGEISKAAPKFPIPVAGAASGTAALSGNLANAKTIRAGGDISTLTVKSGDYEFRNAEPVRIQYSDSGLEIAKAHLVGENTDVEASGTVGLAEAAPLKLGVKGKVNLAALSAVDPELSVSGEAGLDANLAGTVGNPLWRGRLDFTGASVRYGSLPNGLNKVTGAIVFQGTRAGLERITAESGGGTVVLGGLVTYAKASGLRLQVEADIRGVRVRYPEGISTWVDGRLTLAGSQQSSTLAGKLTITKQTASRDFDIGRMFNASTNQPLVASKAGPLGNMRLDVQIVSSPDVVLETTTARNVKGEVDLRIQGSLDRPSWLGRIGILEGEVSIGGRTYTADRGELTFSNPFRIEPSLSLQVRARVEQYEISLSFSGPADRLQVAYSSDPPLPTNEILPLLVAGSSYTKNLQTSPTNSIPELGPGAVLSQALNQQVGSRLDRIFGSGRIRVDPQIAGFNRPANANVAIEQHIANNLTILYVTNVTSVQQRIIQAELTLSPRFSVTAIRDQNGLVGMNFQIKLRFR